MDDLKVDWAEIAQSRMFAHTIVEHLHVLKNGGPSLLMGFEVLAWVLSGLKLHVAERSHFCYADHVILMERGTLTHELSALCCNNDKKTSKENQAWLHHVLLSPV